jgi:hypothetical protein
MSGENFRVTSSKIVPAIVNGEWHGPRMHFSRQIRDKVSGRSETEK